MTMTKAMRIVVNLTVEVFTFQLTFMDGMAARANMTSEKHSGSTSFYVERS